MYIQNYHNTIFLKSIANIKKEKYRHGLEIAIIGYSNSGKSTIINVLTHQKKLAKVSKTPGRTQLINVFEIVPKIRLIDLPGYGYARVPKNVKLNFQNMVFKYLKVQKCLIGLIMSMDIRHPIKHFDKVVINLAKLYHIPILVLLNKADKLSHLKQRKQLCFVRNNELMLSNNIRVELFSSFNKIGLIDLKHQLNHWIYKNINF
ncbi:MAG: ribosome biogenesis GTP-binding protein YihA/YsxC [Buchnera aphidicola (Melaphis rhois)]